MRLHRYYLAPDTDLKHDFWLREPKLVWQWSKVLRYKAGQQVVLFDGREHERLYEIIELNNREAHVKLVTEFERKMPTRNVYLLWSLLKKDKNDWVLQKATEVGASHFWPILAERSEKTGFNLERAQKIVIEAAEQCGRSDIPSVREPLLVSTALEELKDKVQLYVCEQNEEGRTKNEENSSFTVPRSPFPQNPCGILVGPEGGWSDDEKQLFKAQKLNHLNLHDFTLRAETAAVVAVAKLIQ